MINPSRSHISFLPSEAGGIEIYGGELINISSVQTSWSKKKVLHVLENVDWGSLHLRLPRDWGHALEALRRGFDFNSVIDEMESLGQIRLPEDAHVLRSWRPFLEGVVDIGEGKYIQLLREPLSFSQERQISMDFLSLSLRARLGKIDLGRWKELLVEEMRLLQRDSSEETERLLELADESMVCVDLSEETEMQLRQRGLKVKRMDVDVARLPMDVLRRELREWTMRGEELPDDLVLRRIKEHLQFLDLILSGTTFDDAYSRWTARLNSS